MLEPYYAVESFMQRGGDVLYVLAIVVFVMWTLILERLWYLYTDHRAKVEEVKQEWARRTETRSWHAHQIRRALISEVSMGLNSGLPLLQACVGLCTLIGLLGTVSGMVIVFDTMATTGSSSARLMADGVAKSTIPTMSGMVAALSGLFPQHLAPAEGEERSGKSSPTSSPSADPIEPRTAPWRDDIARTTTKRARSTSPR